MIKNIKVSYIYNFLMNFNITSAIWVLYLSHKGLNLIEIGLLESIFHITGFLLEIPTGAIADLYGRKFSIIVGRIMSAVSALLMIFSTSFFGFAISFIISALSFNLNSGSAESIIYDSLKSLNREGEYNKIYGHISFFIEIAQTMAILFGGILSDVRFIYAYILAVIIDISALSVASYYKEPPIEREKEEKYTVIQQIKESVSVLNTKRIVLFFILLYAFISTIDATIFYYGQKHFENMDFSRTQIATIFACNGLLSAIFAKYAYVIQNKLKVNKIIILLPIIDILALVGLAFTTGYVSILAFTLSAIVNGFSGPIFSDYINSFLESQHRATILSFNSLVYSMSMIFFFPFAGFLGESLGLYKTFGIIAIAMVPIFILIVCKLKSKIHLMEEGFCK